MRASDTDPFYAFLLKTTKIMLEEHSYQAAAAAILNILQQQQVNERLHL